MGRKDAGFLTPMTTVNQCCNCKDPVGAEAGEIPFTERKATGEPVESWCPPCFCYHRVLLEPTRYQPGRFIAVKCGRCKMTTIDHGPSGFCGQCGSHNVRVVGPKEHAGTRLQESTLA